MQNTLLKLVPCSLLLAACGGGGGSGGTGGTGTVPPVVMPPVTPPVTLALGVQQVADGLDQPLYLTAPAGDTRQFIVERGGRIRILSGGALLTRPFLDIGAQVGTAGERGLLSLAFDPKYAQNGTFFIYYVDLNGDIAIDRMRVSPNPDVADATSATRLLTIPHREFNNHNGGQLAFGPDGYLYAGTGDGGGAGDPPGNAQNLNVLLGKILRLDVGAAAPSLNYAIPADNPYVNQAGRRAEIWASGVRNPWRFSFDMTEKLLYIADVGQDQREEVDIAPASRGGANYGWKTMEGTACYNATSCDRTGLTLPQFEYLHGNDNVNGCSITGGFVYRGAVLPELAGHYFYSDYCAGFLKSFAYRDGAVTAAQTWNIGAVGKVLSFGQDGNGELYMLSDSGKVYRIVRR
ncbi:MAG: PQQ-dependent sugar dehydrogenase [Pseudomonadota bacterium]